MTIHTFHPRCRLLVSNDVRSDSLCPGSDPFRRTAHLICSYYTCRAGLALAELHTQLLTAVILLGYGYTGSRTTTKQTQQSGQTVQVNHFTTYCSGNNEPYATGEVPPSNFPLFGPTKQVCFQMTVWPDTCCFLAYDLSLAAMGQTYLTELVIDVFYV